MRIPFKVCSFFINDHCPWPLPTISKFAWKLHTLVAPPIMVGSSHQHVYQLSFVNIVHLPILSHNSSPSFIFFSHKVFALGVQAITKVLTFIMLVATTHTSILSLQLRGAHQQIFKPYKYGQIFKFMVKFH